MYKKLLFISVLVGYSVFFYLTFESQNGFMQMFSFGNYSFNIWINNKKNITKIEENMPFKKFLNTTNFNLTTEFRFQLFNNTAKFGKSFNKTWNVYLNETNLLNVVTATDEIVLNSTPVIVTAFNSRCYGRAHGLLDCLMKVYQNTKIIYVYDLGLSEHERTSLVTKYGSIIYEIRHFNFKKYPEYVSDLFQFRWKPLVIADMLKQFHSIWWMDSAILVYKPLSLFYPKIRKRCNTEIDSCCQYPWTFLDIAGHGIFAATDKRMFDYLVMPEEVSKNLSMGSANVQLIFATKQVREDVLRFWVLCALEKDCMAPEGSRTLPCNFDKTGYKLYAGCHRQDQSALSVILANVNQYEECRYYVKVEAAVRG